MSWFTQWLPGLPSIDFVLPSGLQRRFMSFALRQTLGHFLQPGQLDVLQIDSQIGSGYVQIRDVELNNEAINALIAGLPIQLHDGSIGKVTARIPLPNPLTSSVGLSIESLHLTFRLAATAPKTPRPSYGSLAESVASVADTFVHEELYAPEEYMLREPFHPDPGASSQYGAANVPGGLDPFIPSGSDVQSEMDPPGVSIFATLLERLLSRFHFDASDIQITLVHPGSASFTLKIPEIQYATSLESSSEGESHSTGNADFSAGVMRTLLISGTHITTRSLLSRSVSSPMSFATSPNPEPAIQYRSSVHSPPTPISPSSDIDEDTQTFMSQSLATLPPRPVSPNSSVSGSLYQSALSTAMARQSPVAIVEDPDPQTFSRPSSAESIPHEPTTVSTPSPPQSPPHLHRKASLHIDTQEIQDEMLISLGSEPMVFRLFTPPNVRPGSSGTETAHNAAGGDIHTDDCTQQNSEPLKMEMTLGNVACCFKARHLRSLLDVAVIWTSHFPPDPVPPLVQDPSGRASRPVLDTFDVTLKLRGIVLLISPSTSLVDEEGMQSYWSNPLVPPHLACGCVRVHLDSFYIFVSITDAPPGKTAMHPQTLERRIEGSLSLCDLSIFVFHPSAIVPGGDITVLPILITDQHITSQYACGHVHPNLSKDDPESRMPTFDVTDWTQPSHRPQSARLSHWRSEFLQAHPVDSQNETSSQKGAPRSQGEQRGSRQTQYLQQPAVKANVTIVVPKAEAASSRAKTRPVTGSSVTECIVAPLHIFVDVGSILESRHGNLSPVLQFLEELTAQDVTIEMQTSLGSRYHESSEDEDDAVTPAGSPRAVNLFTTREHERERERRRLEQLVIEDLDLDFDYRQDVPERRLSQGAHPSRSTRKRNRKTVSNTRITINMAMIRVQIRVPPPPSSSSRSGALVIDLHDFQLSPGNPVVEKPTCPRFSEPADLLTGASDVTESAGNVLVAGLIHRIVVAYCPMESTTAVALVSLGVLPAETVTETENQDIASDNGTPVRVPSLTIPRIVVSKSNPSSKRSLTSVNFVTTAVAVDIPSVFVHISKAQLDGLQLWADDLTQLLERAFSETDACDDDVTERRSSKNPSLIESRFFAKTQRSRLGPKGGSVFQSASAASETIVKVLVHKVALRVVLPRTQGRHSEVRPFDVLATDVDMLLEVKPEGKDETVLTLGMMDTSIYDHADTGTRECYLTLTVPRDHVQSSKPLLKLRFTSLIVPETIIKESKIKVTLCGLTYNFHPDIAWIMDLAFFVKAPPGAFESVVPSERTYVSVKVIDTSVRAFAPDHPGAVVLYLGETEFGTTVVGNSSQMTLRLAVNSLSLYLTDDTTGLSDIAISLETGTNAGGVLWKRIGYTLLTELTNLNMEMSRDTSFVPSDTKVVIDQGDLRLHLCADTTSALIAFVVALRAAFAPAVNSQATPSKAEKQMPTTLGVPTDSSRGLMASVDEHAFARAPDLISAPDMISDDLPTNLDYLDESFGAGAGLRELTDDDLDEFGHNDEDEKADLEGLISKHGGETIRLLHPEGLRIIEHHFDTLPPDPVDDAPQPNEVIFRLKAKQLDVTLFLYDGYDWARTRRIIEEERKNMRRKLAKIRQLVASGQTPDPSVEETNTLLFNSVYIGLEHNLDELDPDALLAAIDDELKDDQETASESSWQSLVPPSSPRSPSSSKVPKQSHARHRVSKRSRGPSIEFRFMQLSVEFDQYRDDPTLASRVLVTIRDVEILDHIKTSTWRKFLAALTTDSKGNIRETDSNMVRVELRQVYPALGHPTQEARLRMKILPLRLHVDQDALDFLKKFFSFKDPDALPQEPSTPSEEIYFQQAEVFPVDLKLDYKPRRVDYRALRDGRTIELMNFFHFDGAEMTLRHITLTGITGWAKMFDLLNELWTPDVKATQLVEVISGVAPIRSVVNVGSGVADLVLLPIAQYRKDGRVVRGLQKGTKAFVKSTATEAIKLGARLATGTQVILEQAENVIGGQFESSITAEAMPLATVTILEELADEDTDDLISRYADQPTNVKEGVQSAYQSLRKNLNSAAQTILAVPMEVYERSGNEGTVRAVVRAVPIAVLKPMIGASEAISKTLLGLHNTLDPGVRLENEAKYKQR